MGSIGTMSTKGVAQMNCRTAREAIDTSPSQQQDRLEQNLAGHIAECGACASYADGTFKLIALMQSQPRVEAPPDFDFRLRARIARERDVQHGLLDRLAAFWQKSFSPARAAAALALVAVSITSGTIYFSRNAGEQNRQDIAAMTEVVPAVPASSPSSAPPSATVPGPVAPAAPGLVGHVKREVPRGALVSHVGSTSEPRVVAVRYGGSEMTSQEVWIYRPGGSRSIIVPRRGQSLGAELAGLQKASLSRAPGSAAPVPAVETF